jgi:long-subunit acyl-CoA synthetase (AMP-forming)
LFPYVVAYACSTQSFTVALIVVNRVPLKQLAESLGLGDKTVEELCHELRVAEEVQKACAALAKGKLTAFEIPKKVVLDAEPWTPENGMVTAAFKLKRTDLYKAFKVSLDGMYEGE